MISSEQILEDAARDGSIDLTEWPRVLESVLKRLHDIVHNDFPLPSLPLPTPLPSSIDPEVVASTPPRLPSDPAQKQDELPDAEPDENVPPPNSQSSTKENDAPADTVTTPRPPVPAFSVNHPAAQPPHPPPPDAIDPPAGTFPPDLLSLYTSSTRMLEYDFAHSPPYTIQRLAELVLRPKKHYRFLPAYLRALDRIVSVSSPVSDFPLPALHAPPNGTFLTNGNIPTNGSSEHSGLGSDESLGGALLTPIPWLRHNSFTSNTSQSQQQQTSPTDGEIHTESTSTILGPHGAGSIETVSVTVNGVSSAAHTAPAPAPSSPTLSEQSDASSSSSSGGPTDAQLREQGAVTQGELLRQEQEAGVVPLTQNSPRRSLVGGGAAAVGRSPLDVGTGGAPHVSIEQPAGGFGDGVGDGEGGQPHARGPEEISVEDMGPQPSGNGGTSGMAGGHGHLNMEAAVGRGRSKSPQPPAANPAVEAEAEASRAKGDDAGAAGRDPGDVAKEVARAGERADVEMGDVAGEEGGDAAVVADGDGREVGGDGR